VREEAPGGVRRTLRIFFAGAGCGLLAGAFLVATIVWHFGNVIGSQAASREHPANPPSALDRWRDAIDDVGDPVIKLGDEHDGPVGTSGVSDDVRTPPPSPEPVLSAPPAAELEDRDLIVPVEGIAREQLTRSFADKRGQRRHEAIDILAPRHTPVRAVEAGRVARLFYSKAGGVTVYQFDPSERFCYYYAHLDRYAEGLAEGQQVSQGQVIGYVGVTGNAPKDTPHLHFAIFRLSEAKRWWEGTPVDPYDVLR
jgi:murein DD-endopeptidase MepM/ murein hydrolase activator NlpD